MKSGENHFPQVSPVRVGRNKQGDPWEARSPTPSPQETTAHSGSSSGTFPAHFPVVPNSVNPVLHSKNGRSTTYWVLFPPWSPPMHGFLECTLCHNSNSVPLCLLSRGLRTSADGSFPNLASTLGITDCLCICFSLSHTMRKLCGELEDGNS